MSKSAAGPMISEMYDTPATIEANNFKFKSLSCWALNLFVGCCHACRFCYVTETSINKMAGQLRTFGIGDAVNDWGNYVLVRPWIRGEFLRSLRKAERTHPGRLNPDGNRAVMICSTTDPYQTIRNPDAATRKLLNAHASRMRREALEAILEHSTLNVRILTRSPLARQDFELFKRFGNRLMLGTSLPTLDPKLAELYEPHVPHPTQRLKLLTEARAAGIPTYVALAPVFPEVGYEGLLDLFRAVKQADPMTIFLEPVNLKLGIARRIEERAKELGIGMDMSIYRPGLPWAEYAIRTLRDAERAATETGQLGRLHLWPDHDALRTAAVIRAQPDPAAYLAWLQSYWNRVSEWPGKSAGKR